LGAEVIPFVKYVLRVFDLPLPRKKPKTRNVFEESPYRSSGFLSLALLFFVCVSLIVLASSSMVVFSNSLAKKRPKTQEDQQHRK
jgi:hypothetical protein